ncbi:MAG: helix-turn-helix domain-containing protein [Bacteroidetes bacterium]|nr:helix-turn-helix domain-containing protein [Bacteroidota bacterium]
MSFGELLTKVRKRAKITIYRLARDARTDWTYVKRLETGERRRPSRQMVLELSQALLDNSGAVTLRDVDRLLKAAGYGPLPRNRVSIVELER